MIAALTRNGAVHTLRIKRSLCVHRQRTNTLLRGTTTTTWCVINHISDHGYTLDTLHNIANIVNTYIQLSVWEIWYHCSNMHVDTKRQIADRIRYMKKSIESRLRCCHHSYLHGIVRDKTRKWQRCYFILSILVRAWKKMFCLCKLRSRPFLELTSTRKWG